MFGAHSYLIYTLLFCLPFIAFLWMRFFTTLKEYIRKIIYGTLTWTIIGPILWQIAMNMKSWEYKKVQSPILFGMFFREDIVWWFCIGLLFSSFWAISTDYEKRGENFVMKELKRIAKSFANAFRGITTIFSEKNLLIHVTIAVAVILLGFFLHFTSQKLTQNEWLWVILWATLVISWELFNTALEMLADMHTKEHNPLIGRMKDISAGGVLVAAAGAIITGIIIFAPKIYALFLLSRL